MFQQASNSTFLAGYSISYFGLCAGLVFWVARTLHRSGAVFLNDAFRGDTSVVRAVTHLLDVGFYLVCAGYMMLTSLDFGWQLTLGQLAQSEVNKLGFFLLLLGAIHLFNLLLLAIFRRRSGAAAAEAQATP